MRRHRLTICLLALSAGILFAQMQPAAAIIGGAVCVWIIACALMPAPADETTKESYADHRTRPGP